MNFNEFNLTNKLVQSIQQAGFVEPTEIQEKCIPLILQNTDLIGQSQTCTGKTAAFAIPIIEKLMHSDNKKTKALIVCPTRELAIQITQHIRVFTSVIEDIRTVTVYGGQSISQQIFDLKKGADIIVGTPGRILDHLRRKTIRLNDIEYLVLDEADEMLQMGFKEDIETILSQITRDHQTSLFSATMPQSILDITSKYLNHATHVNIKATQKNIDAIEQLVYEVNSTDKTELLMQLLAVHQPRQAMIFCNTKKMVDDLAILVQKSGFNCASLHGDMRQEMRTAIMSKFKNNQVELLIATDVAARGIDVDSLDIVVNYDLPQDDEYYIHRIGRTGRAGQSGKAITLVTPRDARSFRYLVKDQNLSITLMPLPTQLELDSILATKIQKLIFKNKDLSSTNLDLAENLLSKYDPQIVVAALLEQFDQKMSFKAIKQKSKKKSKTYNTYTINIGSKQGMSPKKLVQTASQICGIHQKYIGNISIDKSRTTIDVESHIPVNDMKKLKNMNSSKQVHVEFVQR
jgi:ATP-dependent RNA helicase DeaD